MSKPSADAGNQLLRFGGLADCVVVCGDTEFNVRKDIICRGSPVLKQFCEEGLQQFGAIRLAFADYDLPTVSRVFLYLYTGNYDDGMYPNFGRNTKSIASSPGQESIHLQRHDGKRSDNKDPTGDPQPVFSRNVNALVESNLKVHLCAKALQIKSLEALALVKLESRCLNDLDPADIASIISYVYEHSTHEDLELRTMVMRSCTKNIVLVMRDAEIVSLLKKYEPLASNLLEETWAYVTQQSITEERSRKENETAIVKLEAECQELRKEKESATTSLVKYKGPNLELKSQVLSLKAGTASLASQNDSMRKKISSMTCEKSILLDEQVALRKKLRWENGISRNQQHNLQQKISSLQNKLDNANSRLRDADPANHALGRVRGENESLRKEVKWLRRMLEHAQRLVKDTTECRHCDTAFWALLKVDLHKDDVYVKCGSCGQKH
ncbi:hypothetical protein EPUS_06035 [Endocarpon pusillum Z07020]|uniref:BTB domain-containing protein n=1 Tax=Endocarpon pusillum (strain Z07020 / HMAS-L-300199) TaxID=1263415 RepID=U1GKJ6_ENDPU|nr:uncharacterized protein EPUS_06035 [Endocarpon pusillum Z07020]ERF72406.1 hypothetical protein EPUS_06035 [Endocarpon pusillum Z07020]